MTLMEWRVMKMGSIMFDTLHAYGLGLLLGYAYEHPVLLEDEGCWYRLSHDGSNLVHRSCDLLDAIITLPLDPALLTAEREHPVDEHIIPLANLDGLLGALFTYPRGIRVFSLDDVWQKHRLDPSVPARSLAKVQACYLRWKSLLIGMLPDPACWLNDLLEEYHPAHAQFPIPVPKRRKTDITITMAIDPTFSYGSRQPRSDGTITTRVNMTIQGTRFAALLAQIGAMRFLRAQQVSGNLVNYTLPVATRLSLTPELTLPLLLHAGHLTPESALLAQSIQYVLASPVHEATWYALMFQTLQMQGMQQPVSLHHGNIDLLWFESLKMRLGKGSLFFWRKLLRTAQKDLPYERDCLEGALLSQQASLYLTHLEDAARIAHGIPNAVEYVYSLKEVTIIMDMMEDMGQLPLRPILERKTGTLRFGRALRLLKSSRPAGAREILDALESVQTRDQLVRVLHQLNEECALLAAKTDYVILPSEDDMLILSDDVARYSASTIAGILMLLSSLRYPKSEESPQYEAVLLWRVLHAVLRTTIPNAKDINGMESKTFVASSFADEVFPEGENLDASITDHHL
jgi:hypothetical protein